MAEETTTVAAPTETKDPDGGAGHVRVRLGIMAVILSPVFVAI